MIKPQNVPQLGCRAIMLMLFLGVFFAVLPDLMGFTVTPELGVLAAIGVFVGRFMQNQENMLNGMVICIIIGVMGISLGILIPEIQYASILYWGEVAALAAGVGITCLTAFLGYIRG